MHHDTVRLIDEPVTIYVLHHQNGITLFLDVDAVPLVDTHAVRSQSNGVSSRLMRLLRRL